MCLRLNVKTFYYCVHMGLLKFCENVEQSDLRFDPTFANNYIVMIRLTVTRLSVYP